MINAAIFDLTHDLTIYFMKGIVLQGYILDANMYVTVTATGTVDAGEIIRGLGTWKPPCHVPITKWGFHITIEF